MSANLTSDPDPIERVPVFCGTNVPIQALFQHLATGNSLADFLTDFPSVPREIAVQCIEDAGRRSLAAASAPSAVPEVVPATAEPKPGQNLLRLLELKGIGKEMFAALGGGENFIRSERRAFAEGLERQDRERGLL